MLVEDTPPSVGQDHRRAGILLHLTSLPGTGPCGDLGPGAHHFLDFLTDCGVTVWQMLPVGPTQTDYSPYQSSSVHAGNPRLIGLEPLVQRGWLVPDEWEAAKTSDAGKANALRTAHRRFRQQASPEATDAFARFAEQHDYWLADYALYRALREEAGQPWWRWPEPLRDRDDRVLAQARRRLANDLDYIAFEQYLFFDQWQHLRDHADTRGIRLFGDMPIFVAHDSAEVWARPRDFDLHPDGSLRVVAGVPPDYFSATGQRWGNPLYRWDAMIADGFQFWIDRIRTQFQLFHLVRIDHFRGLESYWEIPADEEFAIHGRWVKASGAALFERLNQYFGEIPLIAEDLGLITEEVETLRRRFRLPGMKVLQFAFSGGAANPYLPFHHDRDSVVYTGTHDNDTTLGWYRSLDRAERDYVDEYLGHPREPMPWPLVRCALASRSHLAVVPMQDILGLDSTHRMNTPGTCHPTNWQWRFDWTDIPPDLPTRVLRLVDLYGRRVG
ncbi:4-alpha-glucanotransferase [Thioalkalicoccus limnaeus]|uniref:4-alpha-glucanotransferase n=1 Tax=Thioalkalicoccus limnaeus TaxID=120681 RepID=A0ABV4BCF9_9GAMM